MPSNNPPSTIPPKVLPLVSPVAVSGLLSKHGLRPQHRLGQNFLVDYNALARILTAAEVALGDRVIEIGAGLGVLTQALAAGVGDGGVVVSVEVDRRLEPALADTLGSLGQVQLAFVDALEVDFEALLSADRFPVKLVANIPYQITSPLIARLLELKSLFTHIVLLVQKEVADRLVALPGTPAYSAFTVFVQYHCDVSIAGLVSPRCFFPPPKVTSAIMRLVPRTAPVVECPDEALLFAIVKAAFGQRRKTLLNALSGDPALGWTRARALAALNSASISPSVRGETLSLPDFARLASS